jgi:hypothetical protein
MINLRRLCLFVVLAVLPTIGVGATAAQGKSGDFSEPEFSAEAAALARAEDDAIAEEKARETDLDPLVIATGYVLNGKKEEAFQFFADYVRELPEEHKRAAIREAFLILEEAPEHLGDEFYSFAIDQQIITLSANGRLRWEFNTLLRKDRYEEAASILELLLDSPRPAAYCIDLTLAFAAERLQNKARVKALTEKLRAKFPNDPRVKLQWIDSLAPSEPEQALAELELLTESAPGFSERNQHQIRLIRGLALEALGEDERAKEAF